MLGIYRLIKQLEITEDHLGRVRPGELHVFIELYCPVRTSENKVIVLSQGTGQCIEMCGHKSHFFCPVVKCFLVRIKAGQTVFRAKQNIFVSV